MIQSCVEFVSPDASLAALGVFLSLAVRKPDMNEHKAANGLGQTNHLSSAHTVESAASATNERVFPGTSLICRYYIEVL